MTRTQLAGCGLVAPLLVAMGAFAAACSSSSNAGDGNPSSALDASTSPASDGAAAADDDASTGEGDADAKAACSVTDAVTLWVDETAGYPSRIYVPASIAGKKGSFLFDTGSETTFIGTPTGTPDDGADGGAVTIGACTSSYQGRPYHAEDARGLPNLGTFGADQVLAAHDARFDLEAGVLERFVAADPIAAGWSATPIERVNGSLLVRVKLDGVAVRLLIDTGSPDILWVGQQKKPGDVESQTADAQGNVLTIYSGTVMADISPSRASETLPVSRMPSFPYFEERVTSEFGGDVQGLFGVAALGTHFAFDTTRMVLLRKP